MSTCNSLIWNEGALKENAGQEGLEYIRLCDFLNREHLNVGKQGYKTELFVFFDGFSFLK